MKSDIEALKHYLKNAVINAKEIRAGLDNYADRKLIRSKVDHLIGFLEGGYDVYVLRSEPKKRGER